MGNTIGTQRLEDLRSYLLESPDIVVHSLLATYKLFKVRISCKFSNKWVFRCFIVLMKVSSMVVL